MSDRAPGVSVVIATHNRPELLRMALDGVFVQEDDLEVVLVFDRSEPDLALIDEYRGRRLRLIRNDRTPGLAGARNAGVLAASQPWIAFCDDDDTWLPGKLAKQFARLEELPEADVCLGGVVVHYEGRTFDRIPDTDRLDFEDLLQSRVFAAHPSTVLVRRHAMLDQIGLVDEEIPGSYGEDYEWLLRAARLAPVAIVPEALVLVRWHAASYFVDRWRLIIDSIDYLLERYPEFESQPNGMAWLGAERHSPSPPSGRARLPARGEVCDRTQLERGPRLHRHGGQHRDALAATRSRHGPLPGPRSLIGTR